MRPAPLLVISVLLAACSPASETHGERGTNVPSAETSIPAEMTLDSPAPDEQVTSPVRLSGTTPGTWYFEGSFPVELVSENGRTLAEHHANAEGNWMTEEDVRFKAELAFSVDEPTKATLILREDDPSGRQTVRKARVSLTLLPGG